VRATMWAPFSGSTTSWLRAGSGHSPNTRRHAESPIPREECFPNAVARGICQIKIGVSLSCTSRARRGNRAANVVPSLEWHPRMASIWRPVRCARRNWRSANRVEHRKHSSVRKACWRATDHRCGEPLMISAPAPSAHRMARARRHGRDGHDLGASGVEWSLLHGRHRCRLGCEPPFAHRDR